MESHYESYHLAWESLSIDIAYCRHWTQDFAHIEVQCAEPLPITETGYRSHFCHPEIIEQYDDPVAFVRAWLDYDARKRHWQKLVEARRQGQLF